MNKIEFAAIYTEDTLTHRFLVDYFSKEENNKDFWEVDSNKNIIIRNEKEKTLKQLLYLSILHPRTSVFTKIFYEGENNQRTYSYCVNNAQIKLLSAEDNRPKTIRGIKTFKIPMINEVKSDIIL